MDNNNTQDNNKMQKGGQTLQKVDVAGLIAGDDVFDDDRIENVVQIGADGLLVV